MKTSLFLIWICCFTSFTHAEDFIQSAGQDIRTQVIEQEQVEETLKKEKENANSDLIKAENLAKQAKEQVQLAESETEKTLAEFLVLLQSYRTDISNLKLNKIKNIELKIDLMKEKTEALKKSENRLRNNPQGVTVDDLNQATEIWREIVDGTVTNIFQEDLLHINDPPKPPAGLTLSGDKFQDIKTKIQEALAASAKEKMEIEQNIAKIKRSQRDVSARLLLNAGRVRAGVMKALMDRDLYTIWDFSEPILYDYLREVKVVPHRLLAVFLEKYFDFRLMNQEGLRGWFRIFKEATTKLQETLFPKNSKGSGAYGNRYRRELAEAQTVISDFSGNAGLDDEFQSFTKKLTKGTDSEDSIFGLFQDIQNLANLCHRFGLNRLGTGSKPVKAKRQSGDQ